MDESTIRQRADTLVDLIVGWVEQFPSARGSAHRWYRDVLEGDKRIRDVLGFRGSTKELKAMLVSLTSDQAVWRPHQAAVGRRMQIYLGGVEGLAGSDLTPAVLQDLREKIHQVRVELGSSVADSARPARTLTAVATAIEGGTLKQFRTGEADSDLWVVLKTLQENLHVRSRSTELGRLVTWASDVLVLEAASPGAHIADRRHAWWAVRTLFEAEDVGIPNDTDLDLSAIVSRLLREHGFARDSMAASASLVPDLQERLSVAWELVNVSELVRGWAHALSRDTHRELLQREHALMSDLIGAPPPGDLRLATVHLRACLTYLSDPVPSLWGRDV